MGTKLHEAPENKITKIEIPAKAEEHLNRLVQSGDWELLQSASAFFLRSPEGQVSLITQAMDARIAQLVQNQGVLVNGGPEERAAAMGIVQRIRELRDAKREVLKGLYSQHSRVIPRESAKDRVEF